jgi:DNA-binding CsgD family transcriptional regulator
MSVALDDFSTLVGQIYEASLDVSVWPQTLDAVCRFVGAPMGAMGSYSVSQRRHDIHIFSGYEAYWVDLFRAKYGAINPLLGSTNGQGVGEIRCLSAAGLIGAFEGQPMYEEWVKPQRILDLAEVVLDATVSRAATMTFVTRVEDGVLTGENIRRIELLFPHVRRSVLISQVLNNHRRSEGELRGVVDALAAGVFVLGARGQILRSNAAGVALLGAGEVVAARGGVLKFAGAEADRALRDALRGAEAGSLALGGKGTSIPLRAPSGESYVGHILPVSEAAAEGALDAPDGRIAVFVNATHPELAPALETLARTYGLTAAESRVARALAEVGSTPVIARTLGVKVATVRTHLRSLFEKTGARRQVEIVSLLQGFASPFG